MISGVCFQPLVPLRVQPSEKSEMVTQMLFGEKFLLLKESENWSEVKVLNDNYTGWCSTKMLNLIPDFSDDFLSGYSPFICSKIVNECFLPEEDIFLHIPAGSILYKDESSENFFIPKFDGFKIVKKKVVLKSDSKISRCNISEVAMQFLNAPYLWGGKTLMGIDCSGLVQIVFSILGISLPRDASQQIAHGIDVGFDEVKTGDLAFFANESGKIVHVGICLGDNKIIHSSGNVHIDRLDLNGIYSREFSVYTHKLSHIKRIFI